VTAGAIRDLEDRTNRTWPPRSTLRGPGWEIRFGDGLHSRRNSATVWPEAPGSPTELRRHIEDAYRDRGATPIIKLTEASMPGLDEHLDTAGWERAAPTIVMTRSADPGSCAQTDIRPAVSAAWLDVFTAVSGYDDLRRRKLEDLLGDIALPTGFALLTVADAPAAVGLGVVDDDHLGLFEIVTEPAFRGRGLAGQLVTDLLSWAHGRGASTAFLQVEERNAAGRGLYERMGFAEVYRYWYRIAR
jgi:GNAT superfamily N-acetyltransferase